jgi:excisionase family DNA binding protein
MKKLTFEDLPGALELALEKLTQIEHKLADLKEYFEPKEPVELMTRNEVAEYLKVDLSTLWNWTNKGKLTAYGIGARVYYKRNEIEQCLIKFNK